VNIKNHHWFVICIFFQEQKIQVFDTCPHSKGRSEYIDAVFDYVKSEYLAYHGVPLPNQQEWKKVPCGKDNKIVPMQDPGKYNCGIYTCLIMELLLNKVDPWILNDYQVDVDTCGRMVLFQSLYFNKPVFQNCYNADNLPLKKWKYGPYDCGGLFPLTSVIKSREECPYVEELAYMESQNVIVTGEQSTDFPLTRIKSTAPMRVPFDFLFTPPDVNDGVMWSYDSEQRIVFGNFTTVHNIHWRHKQYVGSIMERDDVTLIMEGLLSKLCLKMAGLDLLMKQLLTNFGDQMYHNFKRFDRVVGKDEFVNYRAKNTTVTPMKVKDYVRHLNILMGESPTSPFSYKSEDGQEVKFDNATDVVFYMLDVDMTKHLTTMNATFEKDFKLKEIQPGGSWCMTNSVSRTKFQVYTTPCVITHNIPPKTKGSRIVTYIYGSKRLHFTR